MRFAEGVHFEITAAEYMYTRLYSYVIPTAGSGMFGSVTNANSPDQ